MWQKYSEVTRVKIPLEVRHRPFHVGLNLRKYNEKALTGCFGSEGSVELMRYLRHTCHN